MAPSRFVNLGAARARHGERVDRLGELFGVGDVLADDTVRSLAHLAPPARNALIDAALREGIASPRVAEMGATPELRALFAQLDHVPYWLDRPRADRGGAAFLKRGILGGLVLGSYALVLGYASPAGNKPLAFSGRLTHDGARRLGETSRFVQTVYAPGGVQRFAPGFQALVKVRLMHAAVRVKLAASPKWQPDAWGVPINQADMAGTALLFSLTPIDAFAKLGFPLTHDESEDLLHLWRYCAYLLGVCDELRFASCADARTYWELLSSTQAMPDEDARILTRALTDGPVQNARNEDERRRALRVRAIGDAVSRHLLGDEYADALGFPRTRLVHALRGLAPLNKVLARVLQRMPQNHDARVRAGLRYWQNVVDVTLGKEEATFAM